MTNVPNAGNLDVPPERWLAELFEFEYCAECGGDACHHTAVPLDGNWFARCDYPMPETVDGKENLDRLHPVVEAYRAAHA